MQPRPSGLRKLRQRHPGPRPEVPLRPRLPVKESLPRRHVPEHGVGRDGCLLGRKIVNDKNVEYAHVDYEPKDAEYLKSAKGSASYREIKEWIKEQHDVSVSNLYIAQVKDKLGFGKRENYNKGADGHRVPNCPAEKEKLILEAFKHFRMI